MSELTSSSANGSQVFTSHIGQGVSYTQSTGTNASKIIGHVPVSQELIEDFRINIEVDRTRLRDALIDHYSGEVLDQMDADAAYDELEDELYPPEDDDVFHVGGFITPNEARRQIGLEPL